MPRSYLRRVLHERRNAMPAELASAWEASQAQAQRVEAARQALLDCLPVGRIDPAPVPVGFDLLRDELTAVAADHHAWRAPPVEQAWQHCREALGETLGDITALAASRRPRVNSRRCSTRSVPSWSRVDVWREAEGAWLRQRRREH